MKTARPTTRTGTAAESAACKAMLVAAEPKINALLDEIYAGGLDVAVFVHDPLYPAAGEPLSPRQIEEMRALVAENGSGPLVKVLAIEDVETLLANQQNDMSDRIVRSLQRDRDPRKIPIVFALGSMFGILQVDMPAHCSSVNTEGAPRE